MKQLTFEKENREKLLKGAEKLALAVGSTIGAKGRTVIIDDDQLGTFITKDGVTVARSITLEDPVENSACTLIKQVAEKTVQTTGDGTTTSTILAYNILKEGVKLINEGHNPVEIKHGIEKAVSDAKELIKKYSKSIDGNWDLVKQVGTISANGDESIGGMIADTLKKIGKWGAISVERSKDTETYIDVVNGMQYDNGYIHPNFITTSKATAEHGSMYVLLSTQTISNMEEIMPILQQIVQSNKRKPLLIIAPVEGAALQALIVNHVQGNIPSLVLSPPNVLNDREDILMDIAIATGASLISESQGRKVEKATLADLGVVDKVIATKSNAILIGCGGDINEINERVSVLEAKLEQETIPALKERLQMRLAKLTQGISVFYVGGHTEAEIREKKDRVDDAIGATRAALKEGVCAGGGWTYALISDELSLNLKNYSGSFKEGYDIVLRALSTPLYKIYENAGIKDKYVFDVLESNTTNKDIKPEKIKGINAVNGDEGFLFEMGIIDPTLTLITALENSASIAGLLLISSTTINQFNKQ